MSEVDTRSSIGAVDTDRPRLHIHPEHGWLNDPNGLCRIDETYHVFYQHNPAAPVHDDIHWAHVSSTDLLHWSPGPLALVPRPGGPDGGGCFSGVVVDDDGVPTAVYTGVRTSTHDAGVTLARSDRTLREWTADTQWRVGTPDDPGISDVRDPFVFTFDGRRYAVQGAGHQTGRPQLLLYGCDDLTRWIPLGSLLSTDDPIAAAVADANIWECPNLFRLGDRWVLILSLWRDHALSGVRCLVGDLMPSGAGLRFVAGSGEALDKGPSFYAPQVLVEPDRVLLWGWAWEGAERTAADIELAGWSGTLTFPRELRLVDGGVSSVPARELAQLRRERLERPGDGWIDQTAFELVTTAAFELATIDAEGHRRVVVSSAGGGARLLVDGSLIELFSGTGSHTTRAYRERGERWQLLSDGATELWRLGLDD